MSSTDSSPSGMSGWRCHGSFFNHARASEEHRDRPRADGSRNHSLFQSFRVDCTTAIKSMRFGATRGFPSCSQQWKLLTRSHATAGNGSKFAAAAPEPAQSFVFVPFRCPGASSGRMFEISFTSGPPLT